jgi:GntR family transcriptional regulator, transcriptional repressor for pyruvate dehydrogenase complex
MGLKLGNVQRESHLPIRVASLISREIAQGRIRRGERLPTEQALAHSLGVSRNVVREAIARLRSEGIVESRQGVGVFVTDGEARSTLRIDREALKDRAAFTELFELRRILEVHAAGLAAERRSAEALREIATALERMRKADGWDAATVDADLEFHRAVAAATTNAYIASFVGFISEQVREAIVTTRAGDANPASGARDAYEEHAHIHAAIERGDPVAAGAAMEHHILMAAGRLQLDLPRRV